MIQPQLNSWNGNKNKFMNTGCRLASEVKSRIEKRTARYPASVWPEKEHPTAANPNVEASQNRTMRRREFPKYIRILRANPFTASRYPEYIRQVIRSSPNRQAILIRLLLKKRAIAISSTFWLRK